MQIGSRIREMRKSKILTLKELSRTCRVDLATLSRIETNKMTGTLKSHQAIASSLGINLAQLYGEISTPAKPVEFQSQKNRTDLFLHNDKASYYMLTNNVLSKKMMPAILKIAPKGISTTEELPKNTEKFIYILNGECKVYVGPNSYTLKKGETLYFDASMHHYIKNTGKKELEAISIITPPAL